MQEAVRQILGEMTTPGGREWVMSVLSPAADRWQARGTPAVHDGYSKSVLQPWPQIASWVDGLGIEPAEAKALPLVEAFESFLGYFLSRVPAPAEKSLSRRAILGVLDELDWDARKIRVAFSLGDSNAEWMTMENGCRQALFRLAGCIFMIGFTRRGSGGAWTMGWDTLIDVPAGSGLFPRAADMVSRLTQEFMAAENPETLSIRGSDPKRSSFYAVECPAWAPDGYDCQVNWRGDGNDGPRGLLDDVVFRRTAPAAGVSIGLS
jgi:hypothetical protein